MHAIGPVFFETWRRNPERMCFAATRYKFVRRLLDGNDLVAEIGAADGFLSKIIERPTRDLLLFDLAPAGPNVIQHDIVAAPLPEGYFGAIYMIDVLEHIAPPDEPSAMRNICASLQEEGIFIAGVPSRQSQAFANPWSKIGHVNCRDGRELVTAMRKYFANVFLFTMNDEQIGTGTGDLAYYLFVLCCGPQRRKNHEEGKADQTNKQ